MSLALCIISDGTPNGTKVVDAATGQPVEGVTHIHWQLGVNDSQSVATITFIGVPVDLKADTELIESQSLTAVHTGNTERPDLVIVDD